MCWIVVSVESDLDKDTHKPNTKLCEAHATPAQEDVATYGGRVENMNGTESEDDYLAKEGVTRCDNSLGNNPVTVVPVRGTGAKGSRKPK